MASRALTIEEILTLLSEHPKRIAELTAGRPVAHLHTEPEPGEWSVNDVLAHIRACADVWGGAIARIIAEDAPTLKGLNPRTRIKQTGYPDLTFRTSLRAFVKQRSELLAVLESLPPEGWSRRATVLAWGQQYEKSVLEFATKLAGHERIHVKQIAAALDGARSARAIQ
jgi:hypothetical protein